VTQTLNTTLPVFLMALTSSTTRLTPVGEPSLDASGVVMPLIEWNHASITHRPPSVDEFEVVSESPRGL
jgi:hypothetical protein